MPQGYYTIEQWTQPGDGTPPAWIAILHLPLGSSLTAAESALETLGKPGFYRIVQIQRVLWAEEEGDQLRLRKSHAASPESLDRMREMYERCEGRYPVEEVRQARKQAKARRARPDQG
jgi:hypothetical protein